MQRIFMDNQWVEYNYNDLHNHYGYTDTPSTNVVLYDEECQLLEAWENSHLVWVDADAVWYPLEAVPYYMQTDRGITLYKIDVSSTRTVYIKLSTEYIKENDSFISIETLHDTMGITRTPSVIYKEESGVPVMWYNKEENKYWNDIGKFWSKLPFIKQEYKTLEFDAEERSMPEVSFSNDFGENNWIVGSSNGTSVAYPSSGYSDTFYNNGSRYVSTVYDNSKSYAVIEWKNLYNQFGGRTEFSLSNNSGSIKLTNESDHTIILNSARVAVCSSNDVDVITVYDSENNEFHTFRFIQEGITYYYVLDGEQDHWVDNLSSIGYRLTPIEHGLLLYFENNNTPPKGQKSVTRSTTPDNHYNYVMFLSDSTQDETTLFIPDPRKQYLAARVNSSTQELEVLSEQYPTKYADKISDMTQNIVSTAENAKELFWMRGSGELFLGWNCSIADLEYTGKTNQLFKAKDISLPAVVPFETLIGVQPGISIQIAVNGNTVALKEWDNSTNNYTGSYVEYKNDRVYAIKEYTDGMGDWYSPVGICEPVNVNGYIGARNISGSIQDIFAISCYSCLDTSARVVRVYDSSFNPVTAFRYTVNEVNFYFVLDGAQTDWTSDLYSIGYFQDFLDMFFCFKANKANASFSANDYWASVIIDENDRTKLESFGVPTSVLGGTLVVSREALELFLVNPIGLYAGLRYKNNLANMNNFYCGSYVNNTGSMFYGVCILSREAYSTQSNTWKCRFEKDIPGVKIGYLNRNHLDRLIDVNHLYWLYDDYDNLIKFRSGRTYTIIAINRANGNFVTYNSSYISLEKHTSDGSDYLMLSNSQWGTQIDNVGYVVFKET